MTKRVVYGVYGASGHGREVMPIARQQLRNSGIAEDSLVFVDDDSMVEDRINGCPVMSYAQFLQLDADQRFVSLAIANSAIREKLAKQCLQDDVKAWTVKASNIVEMDEVELGEGAILSPFVAITSNIKIGDYFHANIHCSVSHDCILGDFVTFAPGVRCNGNVRIEDHAYVGAGAVIKQGKPGRPLVIGKGAVVGMGSVVTKDVPDGVTVVGNPARPVANK